MGHFSFIFVWIVREFCYDMWKVFIALTICGCSYAITEEELKMEFVKLVMKCNKDSVVGMMELALLQQYVIPTKSDTKCLLACAYKAAKIMTPNGLYDIDHAYSVAEMMKNGDDKRLENAKKMADICVKVNEVEVKDDDKGCERAVLIFKCTIENAPKFGFKL